MYGTRMAWEIYLLAMAYGENTQADDFEKIRETLSTLANGEMTLLLSQSTVNAEVLSIQ